MNEKQLIINNLFINYCVFEGKDQAEKMVVFLHGWRSEGRIWGPVIERLLPPASRRGRNDRADHNFYALDLPGFGKSEMPNRAFTVGDYAGIVEGFIEKVVSPSTPSKSPPSHGGEISIVGHSFGGRVAIKLAVTRPDLVQKLVLVDSAGIRVAPPAKLLKNIVAKIFKPLFGIGFLQPLRAKLYKMIGAEDYVATPELKETFLNTINEDLTPFLRQINIPTLIVWGEHDKEVPVEHGRKMYSLIPNSRFLILKNAGHYSFLDEQKEFVKELTSFLSFPSPGAGRDQGRG